jgi:hypothetical protein
MLIVFAAAGALTGCATSGTKSEMGAARSGYASDFDYAKMQIMTEDAQRRGYRIVWVHPPQKKKATSDSASAQ